MTLWEYVITFQHEVAIVWRGKATASSLILLGVRWSMVATQALSIFAVFHGSNTVCESRITAQCLIRRADLLPEVRL